MMSFPRKRESTVLKYPTNIKSNVKRIKKETRGSLAINSLAFPEDVEKVWPKKRAPGQVTQSSFPTDLCLCFGSLIEQQVQDKNDLMRRTDYDDAS